MSVHGNYTAASGSRRGSIFRRASSRAAFGALCWRAYVLQVRESERLKSMAEDQYLKDVELPPKRGRILDRNGVELAASTEVDSVHVNARMLIAGRPRGRDGARARRGAAPRSARARAASCKARRYFTWVKRRIAPDEARAVRELAAAGRVPRSRAAPLLPEPRAGRAAARLGRARRRRAGGDRAAVRALAARRAGAAAGAARRARARGAHRRARRRGRRQPAHDLYTTIDRYIQFRLEHALEKGVSAHHAKAGVAVALDPTNGEILAMAAVPSLNPNEPDGARERGARNRAVTDPFEPGSTMKTFTIAGALEAGAIKRRRELVVRERPLQRRRARDHPRRRAHRRRDDGGRARQVVEHLHGQDRGARRARQAARDAAALRLRAAHAASICRASARGRFARPSAWGRSRRRRCRSGRG